MSMRCKDCDCSLVRNEWGNQLSGYLECNYKFCPSKFRYGSIEHEMAIELVKANALHMDLMIRTLGYKPPETS